VNNDYQYNLNCAVKFKTTNSVECVCVCVCVYSATQNTVQRKQAAQFQSAFYRQLTVDQRHGTLH